MSEPKIYYFRTIEDLHQIPEDKLTMFALDLVLWLQLHRVTERSGFAKVTTPRDEFGWVDDGRHDVTLNVTGLDAL